MKKLYRLIMLLLPASILFLNSCKAQTAPSTMVNAETAMKVESKQVGNCIQTVPAGWLSMGNKEGSAIDLFDAAHTMYAGWGIFPVNSNLAFYYDKELYNKNPERSVLRVGSMIASNIMGEQTSLRYTNEINEQISNYQLRSVEGINCKGVVLYRIFPGDNLNFTYIEAVRFALTKKDLWASKGELVAGIAASIQCTTQYIPHELPSLPKRPSLQPSASKSKKDDYGYNPQLGTEYCHNPRTGENFRVSPSTNWSETGPDGPGYYGWAGNERIKMAPGRSN